MGKFVYNKNQMEVIIELLGNSQKELASISKRLETQRKNLEGNTGFGIPNYKVSINNQIRTINNQKANISSIISYLEYVKTEVVNMDNRAFNYLDIGTFERPTRTLLDEIVGVVSDSVTTIENSIVDSARDTWDDLGDAMNNIDKLYEMVPERYRGFIKDACKEAFGSDASKLYDILHDLSTGDFSDKTFFKGIDVLMSALDEDIKIDVITTSIETVVTGGYIERSNALRNRAIREMNDGDYLQGIYHATVGDFMGSIPTGVVDVGCRLIDDTFKLSKAANAIEVVTGVNPGKVFNNVTSGINKVYKKIFNI